MPKWSVVVLACAFFALAANARNPPPRQVFIAGDSTASEYGPERAPREGWGQALDSFLDDGFVVRNHAKSGRSSRSFIEQGWFDGIASGIKAGDVLLIQFGHNDAKNEDPARYNEPQHAFPQWLTRYVDLARQRGATPILITPVAVRRFEGNKPVDTHGPYAQAVRDLAAAQGIGLIDLSRSSMDWLRALGEAPSRDYYMHVPEQQQADDVHFQHRGAVAIACLVVDGWKRLDPSLAQHVTRDTDCGAPATALADLAGQRHPSLIVSERELAVDQPGPHGGGGKTTAYPFFRDAPDLQFEFRKRVLHKGAGIGLHQHHKDEIYYVLSGSGRYVLDGQQREVGPGDAMLTRPGSSHAIHQTGEEDLVLLIMYGKSSRQ
jgi:lysophospholipase L1-like esterase/mannose-6-phosphate isomerase-like protein (cupin superfamily)